MRFLPPGLHHPRLALAGGSPRSFRVIAFSYRAILYCFLAFLSRVEYETACLSHDGQDLPKMGRGGTIARAASYKEGMGVD